GTEKPLDPPKDPRLCGFRAFRVDRCEVMFDKLATEEQRYEELMRLLGTTEVQSDPSEYRKHAKALSEVEPLIERFREYKTLVHDITGAEELVNGGDADMRDLAREEL